jgi:hypothetical protein
VQHDELTTRIERAEVDAFVTLYRAAAETCGTGVYDINGIQGVWSPRDDDPGFSCIMNLADAANPGTMLAKIENAVRDMGAVVIGIDGAPGVNERLGDDELRALGFLPDYQERMWGLVISEVETPVNDPRVTIERIDRGRSDEFARVLNLGYSVAPDHVRGHIFASTIGHPGWTHYLVSYDGSPGSASVLYTTGGVAQLFVATTMPEFRGRGGQTALIRLRLLDALAAGCDIATSQTVIDNASPRNMSRHGFQPLYDRWIYGKPLAR